MTMLAGPLINTFLSLLIGQCIRYYPLRDNWRVSLKTIIAVYGILYVLLCAAFILMRDYFAADYLGNQIFKGISGIFPLVIPFILIRNSFFGNCFLMAVVANYILIVFGLGNYVELTYGGAFAAAYPYMICNGVVVLLSIPLLPLLLRALRRIFDLFPGQNALIWKFIWIIPVLFAALCLMSANIFMGENAVTAVFIFARVLLGVGMVVTCVLFARALRQEAHAQELIAEGAALTRVNQLKTDLMQTFSHETLTPLAVMMGYAQITAKDARKQGWDDDLVTNLDTIADEAGRMAGMMDEMRQLALAREYSKDKHPVDLASVIHKIVGLYAKVLQRQGTTLATRVGDGLPLVYGNDSELAQVLFNLLRNADTHTKNGLVTIHAAREEESVIVTISDTGTGISPALLPRIFERGVHDESGGSGFGLAICRDIISAYGGNIWIESDEGEGTRAMFTLPVYPEGGESDE